MHEKSDLSKILEGRCRGKGKDYVAFKKANESHSSGTAAQSYDAIEKRIVDTLSKGETEFFWLLRFDENVVEIREQFALNPKYVAEIAVSLGFRVPKRILSTDFLVSYSDGRVVAYSVKDKRTVLDKTSYKNEGNWKKMIRRQMIEKCYWENIGVEFQMVFAEELNHQRANNIRIVMKCYDPRSVLTLDQKYRYLIAHHHVEVDLDSGFIPFVRIAKENREEIERLYMEKVTEDGYGRY